MEVGKDQWHLSNNYEKHKRIDSRSGKSLKNILNTDKKLRNKNL